ncbi:MAG: hypothetical protein K2G49_01570, partial [Muribaculum sp.]|nr:hypothetical protein [Muribaculum sp.]
MQITACKPHRVAVGASGSSPETHTMHPFPRRRHNNTTTGRYAGELPLAPTLHVYANTTPPANANTSPHANYRMQTTSRSCRGE